MPFCPVCEDEFRPGFSWCRRCNAQLVPELPQNEPEPDEPDEILSMSEAEDYSVHVHVGVPGAQFDLVRSLLLAAGVRLHVQTIGSGRWLEVGSLGAFSGIPTDFNAARILVVADDEDEALGVLEDARSGRLALDEADHLAPRGFMARWGSSRSARLFLALLFFVLLPV